MFLLDKFVTIRSSNTLGKVSCVLRLSSSKTFLLINSEWHHIDDVILLNCAYNERELQ